MQNLADIINLPEGTVIDAVQVKVAAVYERKTGVGKTGQSTVQSCELQDGLGNKLRASCWDHPDLTPLRGKELVLHSTQGQRGLAGVAVRFNTYNNKTSVELTVSRAGQFQLVEVHSASTSPAKALSRPVEAVQAPDHSKVAAKVKDAPTGQGTGKAGIYGATVGMALNNAQAECASTGEAPTEEAIWQKASKYIRVAQKLEAGDLV